MRESLVNQGYIFQVAYYITASLMYSKKSVIKGLSFCQLAVTTSSQISNCSSPSDVLMCLVPPSNIWKGFPMGGKKKRSIFPELLGRWQWYKCNLKEFVLVVIVQKKIKLWFSDYFEFVA